MAIKIPIHDETLMPMVLGPVTRVPEYALREYGISWVRGEYKDVIAKSEVDYQNEWVSGDEMQMQLVTEASKLAGFGDNPKILRNHASKVVAYLAPKIDGQINILDHGAGPGLSAESVFNAMGGNEKDRTFFTLLEPAKDKLDIAEEKMKKLGARYMAINAPDIEMLRYVQPGTQSIFVGVASIHHHSHIPFEIYHEVLASGGFLVSSDWHNSVWEIPSRYYKFLERFNWPLKEKGLANFLDAYPAAAKIVPEPQRREDRQANEDITKFWLGYYQILVNRGQQGKNAILPSEGHRPAERYEAQMKECGFILNSEEIQDMISDGAVASNPHQILPGSTLLMLLVGQKP